ncbi:MAG: purine nucleoside permease [Actinomycetota bacterium]|nr:purine nucleoside permease [Actinomycetota bacterium]
MFRRVVPLWPSALVCALVATTAAVVIWPVALAPAPAAGARQTIAPKVLVVTMFDGERAPWVEHWEGAYRDVPVPGLSANYPEVRCEADADLCVMTTDMGYANSASSLTALTSSDRFDLSDTYVLVAGIAGVNPEEGTLGSAHWARYVVDNGLRHEIDRREIPEDWDTNVVPLGAGEPWASPAWGAGTETYRLAEKMLQAVHRISKDVPLVDSPDAASYRSKYVEPTARRTPFVSVCDTLSGDTYWHGRELGELAEKWVGFRTEGRGTYCTSQMEDNGTLTALTRAAAAGRVDLERVAVLRTSSNFDRQPAGMAAAESLSADSGGYLPATQNAYRVANAVVETITGDWKHWRGGVPR